MAKLVAIDRGASASKAIEVDTNKLGLRHEDLLGNLELVPATAERETTLRKNLDPKQFGERVAALTDEIIRSNDPESVVAARELLTLLGNASDSLRFQLHLTGKEFFDLARVAEGDHTFEKIERTTDGSNLDYRVEKVDRTYRERPDVGGASQPNEFRPFGSVSGASSPDYRHLRLSKETGALVPEAGELERKFKGNLTEFKGHRTDFERDYELFRKELLDGASVELPQKLDNDE